MNNLLVKLSTYIHTYIGLFLSFVTEKRIRCILIIKEPIFVYKSTAAAAQAKNAWGPEESVSNLYNKALYFYIIFLCT